MGLPIEKLIGKSIAYALKESSLTLSSGNERVSCFEAAPTHLTEHYGTLNGSTVMLPSSDSILPCMLRQDSSSADPLAEMIS
jgi:hypothetical protein